MPLRFLRQLANRHWPLVLCGWVAIAALLRIVAPDWSQVALEGDLDHLPADSPSVVATGLLSSAFPERNAKSEAIIVFAREDRELSVEDRQFLLDLALVLQEDAELPLVDVWHAKTPLVSRMLLAPAGRAEMVVARLTSPLMAVDNIRVRDRLLSFVRERIHRAPAGLRFGLTGSAIVGGDSLAATRDSLRATHGMTLILVITCLAVIYRAPLLVFIPLATIALAVSVSFHLLACAVDWFGAVSPGVQGLKVFTTTRVIVIVILFGAGTDYCLFLISRYREELARGVRPSRAPGIALRNVASALAGSALTSILGLAVMAFADYGKYASSGPVIAISLAVALAACVTLAPALLRAFGPKVFWPSSAQRAGSTTAHAVWERLSDLVLRRPAVVLAGCLLAAAPFAVIGLNVPVNHDLLSELPSASASLRGAQLVRRNFGEGWLSPVKLLVQQEGVNLLEPNTRFDVALLHDALFQLPEVQDVRSPYLPIGGDPHAQKRFSFEGLSNAAAAGSPLSIHSFVSETAPYAGRVAQLSLILAADPFSQRARDDLGKIEDALAGIAVADLLNDLPNPWRGARFQLAGATPGMRDLAAVTASDERRIRLLTVAAVLLVLLAILRKPLACVYLIATVLLSYWVAMGASHVFFHAMLGDSYHGLDWKAPLFVFVILVAVGQDYNVYLTTRVLEEQARHGPREGLRRAMIRTGGIITSCGLIMAGTFASLALGSLRGMIELGFALALGVMLDTFVVRTVLVPCYFALAARRSVVG